MAKKDNSSNYSSELQRSVSRVYNRKLADERTRKKDLKRHLEEAFQFIKREKTHHTKKTLTQNKGRETYLDPNNEPMLKKTLFSEVKKNS